MALFTKDFFNEGFLDKSLPVTIKELNGGDILVRSLRHEGYPLTRDK